MLLKDRKLGIWSEAVATLISLQLIYSEAYVSTWTREQEMWKCLQRAMISVIYSRKINLADYKNTCLCLLWSGWIKIIPLRNKILGIFGIQILLWVYLALKFICKLVILKVCTSLSGGLQKKWWALLTRGQGGFQKEEMLGLGPQEWAQGSRSLFGILVS